jgi:hypothetical protein
MAKTIGQLDPLADKPDAADEFVINDGGVTKKITATNAARAAWELSGNKSLFDGANIVLGTTTGSKVGTATTQKLGFYNATPVVQPALTADLLDSLQGLGLVASGAGNTPLDLTSGALGCGTITLSDAANVVAGTTNGTKIGTATTQKIGFWNVTPVVQPASANQAALTNSTGGTANGTLEAVAATNTGDRSAAINNNFTELHVLLNEIRTALVNVGIIKGSA